VRLRRTRPGTGSPAGVRRAASRRRRVDRRPRSRDRRDAARLGDASRPSRHRSVLARAGRDWI